MIRGQAFKAVLFMVLEASSPTPSKPISTEISEAHEHKYDSLNQIIKLISSKYNDDHLVSGLKHLGVDINRNSYIESGVNLSSYYGQILSSPPLHISYTSSVKTGILSLQILPYYNYMTGYSKNILDKDISRENCVKEDYITTMFLQNSWFDDGYIREVGSLGHRYHKYDLTANINIDDNKCLTTLDVSPK